MTSKAKLGISILTPLKSAKLTKEVEDQTKLVTPAVIKAIKQERKERKKNENMLIKS